VSAVPAVQRQAAGWHAKAEWSQIEAAAPRVAAVMRRYLRQLGTFLAPASAAAAENALRQLARWMIAEAGLAAVGDIRRDDIEDCKAWLAARPRAGGRTITADAPAADADRAPVLRGGSSNGTGRRRRRATR